MWGENLLILIGFIKFVVLLVVMVIGFFIRLLVKDL